MHPVKMKEFKSPESFDTDGKEIHTEKTNAKEVSVQNYVN